MIKHLAITCAMLVIISCGQNEPLANYEPRSSQEHALKNVLLAFEDGVRQQNSQKIVDILHKSASVMVGRERQILDKDAYIKILSERLRVNQPVSMGKPKMKINGNQAQVKVYMKRGDNNTLVVFNFIRESGRWFIKSWQY